MASDNLMAGPSSRSMDHHRLRRAIYDNIGSPGCFARGPVMSWPGMKSSEASSDCSGNACFRISSTRWSIPSKRKSRSRPMSRAMQNASPRRRSYRALHLSRLSKCRLPDLCPAHLRRLRPGLGATAVTPHPHLQPRMRAFPSWHLRGWRVSRYSTHPQWGGCSYHSWTCLSIFAEMLSGTWHLRRLSSPQLEDEGLGRKLERELGGVAERTAHKACPHVLTGALRRRVLLPASTQLKEHGHRSTSGLQKVRSSRADPTVCRA